MTMIALTEQNQSLLFVLILVMIVQLSLNIYLMGMVRDLKEALKNFRDQYVTLETFNAALKAIRDELARVNTTTVRTIEGVVSSTPSK